MRSVHIQKDKSIFKLSELPAEEYAASMGLPGAPQIRLLEANKAKVKGRGGADIKPAEVVTSQDDLVVGSDESEDEEDEDEDADEDESGSDEDASEKDEESDEGSEEESDEEQPIKVSLVLAFLKVSDGSARSISPNEIRPNV